MSSTQTTYRQTFAEYMEQALYGPSGYYASGRAASGRQGDYFTAPDVGPIFGRLLASHIATWNLTPDQPFHVIECGAGEGVLARSIIQGLERDAPEASRPIAYHAVERSAARRQALETLASASTIPMRVMESLDSLQPGVNGCVIANELIDAFPVHRIRQQAGRLQEAYVESAPDGSARFVWDEPSTPRLQDYLERIDVRLSDGYETEINLAMREWIASASQALSSGLVALIDYGYPAHAYYHEERREGTLRAFKRHQQPSDVLSHRGGMDLTADVDFTSLALDARQAGLEPLAFIELGPFLIQGLERLIAEKRPIDGSPGLRYLIHPDGLGAAFHVLILGKNIAGEKWRWNANRLHRLELDNTLRRPSC